MMSCCINYTAHIQKQDYNYVVIFNVDAEMLHNVQNKNCCISSYTVGSNMVGTRTLARSHAARTHTVIGW